MTQECRKELERRRRREIMDAARKLFYLHGFTGTSMDSIALQAGISKGLIYHYFRSKEQLLLAFSEDVDEYLDTLARMDDPLEALRRFGTDFLVNDEKKFENAPPVQIMLITFANHEFDTTGYEAQNPILKDFGRDFLGTFFQKGMDSGVFRRADARQMGDIYWSFLMGKLLPVKKGNETQPPEVYVDEILSTFLRAR